MPSSSTQTLNESFIHAKKRHQPYINLVNQIYSLEDLFSSDSFKEYKEMELKSLYFRSDKIVLDQEFGDIINKLAAAGIREIFIFAEGKDYNLTTSQLNEFIKEHKIQINFKIAQVSAADIENIHNDSISKNDILGFDKIENYKLIYTDGFSIDLLNNQETDALIASNYAQHMQASVGEHDLTAVQEPIYTNNDPDAIKIELPCKENIGLEVQLQLQLELEKEIEANIEEENELDLDLEQADNKFTEFEAGNRAYTAIKAFFFESFMRNDHESTPNLYGAITNIFKSDKKIKYISSKALDIVIKQSYLFQDGIDSNNMPIGLALKDGIIFASDQRPASMKINEFTIKINSIMPFITNPLEYSWLKWASKASISLHDIYGSEEAPFINGEDQHPATKYGAGDVMLDIPYNLAYRHYTVDPIRQSPTYHSSHKSYIKREFTKEEQQHLDVINSNLEERGILTIFNNIINSNIIKDKGFLLEEKTSLFLEKLFYEILPLSRDSKKTEFFQRILNEHKFKNYSSLEDVFEGLDGFYKKFQEFLIKQEIEATKDLENIVTKIIKNQVSDSNSFKILMGRFINILEHVMAKGGNLAEQFEYLAAVDAQNLLKDPQQYLKAQELGDNIIHKAAKLDKDLVEESQQISLKNSIKFIENEAYQEHSQVTGDLTVKAIRYLSTIPPHQRASIDSYAKYFKVSSGNIQNGCSVGSYPEALKTVEYISSNTLGYKFPIKEVQEQLSVYVTYQADFEVIHTDQSKSKYYYIFAIQDGEIYLLYGKPGLKGEIKLSETAINQQDNQDLIAYFLQYEAAKGSLHPLIADDFDFIQDKIDFSFIKKNPDIKSCRPEKKGHKNHYYGGLSIITNGSNYDLSFDDEIIKKDEIILPKNLDAKIKAWYESGKTQEFITLFPSEIEGTYFNQPIFMGADHAENDLLYRSNNNLAELSRNLADAEKEIIQDPCYAAVGVITDDANLSNGFTSKQAFENVKLLALNIIASSGRYYDKNYPTQEFSAYISLFNVLFSNVKINEQIKRGDRDYETEENYNSKTLSITHKWKKVEKHQCIIDKENLHKKIVDNFIRIFKENHEFNFAQVVALGLVDRKIVDDVILQAKELLQYNGHFTQILRILLSTPVTKDKNLDELNSRGESIARNIVYLAKKHQILTEDGKHPENLEFFAACLGGEKNITDAMLIDLIDKLNKLDVDIKDQLLESFAKTKLPYESSQIIDNNFPVMSVTTLEDQTGMLDIIAKAKEAEVSYLEESKFNQMSFNSLANAKVDFSELEEKYQIKLPSELKDKSYMEVKKEIIANKKLLQDFNEEAAFDFIYIMLSSISTRGLEAKKITEILFNKAKTISDQYSEIEYNQRNLDLLLKKCHSNREREMLLDNIKVPHDILLQLLAYLKELDHNTLATKNHTIPTLLKSATSETLAKHFSSFEIVTNAFLKFDIGIDLAKAYGLIQKIAAAKYSDHLIKKIISYSIDNLDYSVIEILKQINGDIDNAPKIVEWITSITPLEIKKLGKILGSSVKQLLEIKDIAKVQIISDIALKLEDNITINQYHLIVKKIIKSDLEYAKLLKSYLLNSVSDLAQEDVIELVFNNLESIGNAQVIFSEHNLDRFNYDDNIDYGANQISNRINNITFKNQDDQQLSNNERQELFTSFISIIERAKWYKNLNINQMHDKAIELKHSRLLLKDGYPSEIRAVDLEYLSLSLEMMYRETGMFPRDTQIISVLNNIIHEKHIIDEIATSQGKSITTALLASYLWFTGQTVDVVSSAKELAQRDLKEFSGFFKNLGIKISSNIITVNSEVEEYNKGGINYSVAADLALFRSNREFYSNTNDMALNTDVSLICDEVDSVLTSEINYKLAVDLLKTNQAETRALFEYIQEFTEDNRIKNQEMSLSVKNLQLYLGYQFQKYISSYKYPLSLVQLSELKKSSDPQAQKLYSLHRALSKCNKDMDKLFEKLLKSAIYVKELAEGVDYVILKEDLINQDKLLQATPIIKDQPSKGTMFGDGVQAFLHLLIERDYPQLALRFDVSPSSVTIFNVSPKNFFDYYHLSGGRVIGLTGTAGNTEEIEEFRTTNKMLAFSIPKFNEDRKIIKEVVVENSQDQQIRMLEILDNNNSAQPVIIFCQTTKEAEQAFHLVNNFYVKHNDAGPNIQLYAASPSDTDVIDDIVKNAGKDGYITITTPMLGRGTDFLSDNKLGFLAINLCTDITFNSKMQIYGRVGRNGEEGEIISIFNQEIFKTNVEEHMDAKSSKEKALREKSQPLTDVLKYFNNQNHDNIVNAINTNEFISKAWKKLVLENKNQKTYIELRADLVAIVTAEYPIASKKLNDYLSRIDDGIPSLEGNISPSQYYYASYVMQSYKEAKHFSYATVYPEWNNYWYLYGIPNSLTIDKIALPPKNHYMEVFYNDVYKVQAAVIATHAFTLEKNSFKFYNNHFRFLSTGTPEICDQYIQIFIENNNLYCQIEKLDKPIEINIGYNAKAGIPKNIYNNILLNKKLELPEKEAIKEFLIANGHINAVIKDGEGSNGNLMLDEFKKSFAAYKNFVNSVEVNKISKLIENFNNIVYIDTVKLEYGKYQAINITTKVTSAAGHGESILTDGKFLFWINRGTASDESGIKLFKIIKNIEEVRETLDWLKTSHSQTDTRAKIFTLLREAGDNDVPEHVLIPMKAQKIGNCVWTQTKGMLKAVALVGRIGELNELADITSQEWQKALKDSNDIYKDFTIYDRIKRAEAIVFTIDQDFEPEFLSLQEQQEIDSRRDILEYPITHELIGKLVNKLHETHSKYENTIYEKQYHKLVGILDLEYAVDSEMGKALQRVEGNNRQATKEYLSIYQANKMNDFKQLDIIYKKIEEGRIEFAPMQDLLFKDIVEHLINNEYNIANIFEFTNLLGLATKECIKQSFSSEHCIIEHIEAEIAGICLAEELVQRFM